MRGFFYRGDYARVRAAPADIPAHPFSNLVVCQLNGGLRVTDALSHEAGRTGTHFLQHRDSGADLSRSAVAALKSIVCDEGPLHWVKFITMRDSFDGRDLFALLH